MRFLLATVSAYIYNVMSSFSKHLPSVDTDQTSHMDPKIRDFQARSLPLKRFAQVDTLYIYF